jgi:hypothetical protein
MLLKFDFREDKEATKKKILKQNDKIGSNKNSMEKWRNCSFFIT